MDLNDRSRLREIKTAIKRYGLSLGKRRGQNFLVDLRSADKAAVAAREWVDSGRPWALEIGTGMAYLTECLVWRGFRVVTVEVDPGLAALSRDRLKQLGMADSVELYNRDALEDGHVAVELLEAVESRLEPDEGFALVSNLPYCIAAPVITHFAIRPGRMAAGVVMVQKEMGGRMASEPGGEQWGSLGLLCRACYSSTEVLREVKAGAFYPRPRVDSSLIRFISGGVFDLWDGDERGRFSDYAKLMFTQRKRMLRKASSVLGVDIPEGMEGTRRVERLTLEEHLRIFEGFRC